MRDVSRPRPTSIMSKSTLWAHFCKLDMSTAAPLGADFLSINPCYKKYSLNTRSIVSSPASVLRHQITWRTTHWQSSFVKRDWNHVFLRMYYQVLILKNLDSNNIALFSLQYFTFVVITYTCMIVDRRKDDVINDHFCLVLFYLYFRLNWHFSPS